MGWTAEAGTSPAALLAALTTAVRRYLAAPTPGNEELLREELARVERVQGARRGW